MTEDEAFDYLSNGVSRETLERLKTYAQQLKKWQTKINLVSPSSLSFIWSRHMADSAQLLSHPSSSASHWLDLGSGAGFPGMVCAIIAAETHPTLSFTLVESDARKAIFLRTVLKSVGVDAQILTDRIENLPPQGADVISARALAPLPKLLELSAPHLAAEGRCLFLKGSNYEQELASAARDWHMNVTCIPSLTSNESRIIEIRDLIHDPKK